MKTEVASRFTTEAKKWLNVYFTAGMPAVDDTARIALTLQEAGADMIEVGFPYSDPLADGPTIQSSGQKALDNGISIEKILGDLKTVRSEMNTPMYGMLYFNQIMQFGKERFCAMCVDAGIEGLIIPDLPVEYFEQLLAPTLEEYGLKITFLVTPDTDESRMEKIQEMTTGWVYVVSSNATTGQSRDISDEQKNYFNKIKDYGFRRPTMIGFGIHDSQSFDTACQYANGAIIGSAFIRQLQSDSSNESIHQFIKNIKR